MTLVNLWPERRYIKMRYRFISLVVFPGLCLMMLACSPGLYVKMDSSAPEFGPVLIGMKRHEAELHLGTPIFITRLNEDKYKGIYEYQVSPSAKDILCFDMLNFTTLGLGNLIVSPIDRSEGRRHLMAVVYQMDHNDFNNDRVIGIKERIKVSLK